MTNDDGNKRRNDAGIYDGIEENVKHLRYFLQLLFRKQDFRDGQLPILTRAGSYLFWCFSAILCIRKRSKGDGDWKDGRLVTCQPPHAMQ